MLLSLRPHYGGYRLVSERLNALKHGFLAGARSETLIGYDAQSSG